jgi:hypothetical protein
MERNGTGIPRRPTVSRRVDALFNERIPLLAGRASTDPFRGRMAALLTNELRFSFQ